MLVRGELLECNKRDNDRNPFLLRVLDRDQNETLDIEAASPGEPGPYAAGVVVHQRRGNGKNGQPYAFTTIEERKRFKKVDVS